MISIEKIARILTWEQIPEEDRAELESRGITRETCVLEYEEMRVAVLIYEAMTATTELH